MKIKIKVEEREKTRREKAIEMWEYKARKMEFIEWMKRILSLILSLEERGLACSWWRKGDNTNAFFWSR